MQNLLLTTVLNFLADFLGLLGLWSATRTMTRPQRARNAAIAGAFSAAATLAVAGLVAAA